MASDLDGDDLDEELLAVTAVRDGGDSSESEGYEGEASSDSDQDNAAATGSADSGDEASDAYSAGEDDDDDMDYGSTRRRKKKGRKKGVKGKRGKKGLKRKRGGKKVGGSKGGRKRIRLDVDDDEEEEEVFTYKYDKEGYKDEEERQKLMKISEVDREILLMERMEERRKAEELWNMKKSMEKRDKKKSARSSSRSKTTAKTSALQALKDEKLKKSRGISRTMDISDDDEEEEEGRRGGRRRAERREEEDARSRERAERRARETKPFCYDDLVYSDGSTTPLYLRRNYLEQLIQQPNGTRAITGLFVRLNIGDFRGGASYKLCQIDGTQSSRRYKVGNDIVNKKVVLRIGNNTQPFHIYMISNKRPTKEEFEAWRQNMREEGRDLMSRKEVEELLAHAKKVVRNQLGSTDEEIKAHIANTEILHPERVNWTQKKALIKVQIQQLRDEIKVARARELSQKSRTGDEKTSSELVERLETLKADLAVAESNEIEHGGPRERKSRTSVFASLARKNQQLNAEAEKVSASSKSKQARAHDPFARVDTTGASYFAIGNSDTKAKEEPVVVVSPRSPKVKKEAIAGKNWISSLIPDLFDGPSAKPLSEKPLLPAFGFKVTGLDIFDLSGPELRKRFPLPPSTSRGVDAVYAVQTHDRKPEGRIIDFETWRKQNQT